MPIPARFNGVDHLVLKVSDIDRTVAFYESVLGLRVERIFDKIHLRQVRCGANLIDLIALQPGETLPPPDRRGIEHFCLSIEADMDALLESLRAMQIDIIRGPMEVYGARGFGSSIYIADPDGYEIELKVGYSINPVRFP
ncbi:MAG: VOC family protein [Pigmentiphaga sp.]|uniref:VOC family protein n=1 Tax=Pigmentiphaga sp. TaxID=1977564 RepID=UPI0029BA572C|nr:VOC family protein [Pigmentiphaga sp.]MDX3906229.1 VOC family protein [Pigmentiphaga sp.]